MHAEARPRAVLNLRAATAPAGVIGGACGSDVANRRRTLKGSSDESVDIVAKDKAPQSRKRSRPTGNKSANQQHTQKPARVSGGRNKGATEPRPAAAVPRQSKQAQVIALLRRSEGVTVAEVVAATGRQPHTVRGLFSGTLKKKLGLSLSSAQEDRGRIYRIVDAGAAGEPARAGGMPRESLDRIREVLRRLPTASRAELTAEWRRLYRAEPPARIGPARPAHPP